MMHFLSVVWDAQADRAESCQTEPAELPPSVAGGISKVMALLNVCQVARIETRSEVQDPFICTDRRAARRG